MHPTVNPGIPAPVLGIVDLNRRIQSGQPLDYTQVTNTRASAKVLKGLCGKVVFIDL